MKNFFSKLLIVSLMILGTHLWAAKPIRPPVKVLVDPNNRIAIVQGMSNIEQNKATFKIKNSLYGNDAGEVSLQLNQSAQKNYQKGNEYLVVYSYVMKDPVVRDEKVTDPEGPRILNYFFLDAAMFQYDSGIEKIFNSQIEGKATAKTEYVSWLIENLESTSELNQQLAVFEFNMRHELHSHFTEEQVAQVKQVFENQSVDNELLSILLKTMPGIEHVSIEPWLLAQSRKLIKQHGGQVEFTSYVPGLVQEAIKYLGDKGVDADQLVLKELLFSNHPGIARDAVKSLFAINATTAKTMVGKEINNKKILSDARRAIKQRLN